MKLLLLIALGVPEILTQSAGNKKFIGNVYKELMKTYSGTFLVCPVSAKIILALVRLGARGSTAQQLSKGLRLPKGSQKIKKYIKQLVPKLQGNKDYELISANKIYVDDGFEIDSQYKSTAVDVFKAEIQNINFGNTETAANEINKWTKERTNKKIQNMVNADFFSKDTMLVLINAMYFHGTWLSKFDENRSERRDFYTSPRNIISIDMMVIASEFNFYHNSKILATFLEIPYKDNDVTLTIVLPKDTGGLSELETHIAEVLDTPEYSTQYINVIIPKFKIETTIDFVPILRALGIEDAFSSKANFSGIGASKKESLMVSQVLQKTFIEVDEEGTTAAASSAVTSKSKSKRIVSFVANHPFIFYLKSKAGVIFVGRYTGTHKALRSMPLSELKEESHECI